MNLSRRRLLARGATAIAAAALPRRLLAMSCQARFTDIAEVADRMADRGIVPYDLTELRGWITPVEDFFIRNHFSQPQVRSEGWRVEVGGLVANAKAWTLDELRALGRDEAVVTLECAGNSPLHNHGMLSTARWGGVRLETLLARAKPAAAATDIVFTGADGPRDGGGEPYARSMPVAEALATGALLAWEMNGAALSPEHGAPFRLIVPGWYGMASVKWLESIELRAEPFRGRFQTKNYVNWVKQKDGQYQLEPVTRIGLKSIVASVEAKGDRFRLRGAAWGGEAAIARVLVTADGGQSWQPATLESETAPGAWRLWRYEWRPRAGTHVVASRAIDAKGTEQRIVRPPELASAPYALTEVVGRRIEVEC